MKFIISALTVIAVCCMVATGAEEKKKGGDKPKANPEAVFKKMDANGDGKLSKDEFMAKQKDAAKGEAAFKAKDKDCDGNLSLDEFKTGPAKKGKKKE
ncbi:MAG: EF-hand domain-containing protein [Verrucomicrobia bacterium]|nr:EF-hand domain-containing protein [Verrucomicrobiota bacterium]